LSFERRGEEPSFRAAMVSWPETKDVVADATSARFAGGGRTGFSSAPAAAARSVPMTTGVDGVSMGCLRWYIRDCDGDGRLLMIAERRESSEAMPLHAAYKDITAVMRAQGELTRIVRRLRPVLCYKGT
jgi:hypothetical protein